MVRRLVCPDTSGRRESVSKAEIAVVMRRGGGEQHSTKEKFSKCFADVFLGAAV